MGGILILTEDITRRKLMEEALSDMSRKLIESQEQERARIGRELHDDINQRLAMLSLALEELQENPSEVQSRVQELPKSDDRAFERCASNVARLAFFKTGISGGRRGDQKLVQGIQ